MSWAFASFGKFGYELHWLRYFWAWLQFEYFWASCKHKWISRRTCEKGVAGFQEISIGY
jgi:hypothetical protein